MASEFDLVIRNGNVADGRGAPLFKADVAVSGGRIVQVGKVSGRGAEEIDAEGLLVTPGFIDVHTHYDGQVTWESTIKPSSWHGVTTIVMGNCGVGFAPVKATDHDTLIELMEGIEDIPGTALHEGLTWNWESFKDYLDVLGRRRFDLDICAQLPHAPLRLYVMGDRATRHELATPEDCAKMRLLARQAVEAGAVGFSTSRSVSHKSISGEVTPSYGAHEDELTAIAMGLKDAGSGVLQWVSDWSDEHAELEMILRIARASGRPLSVSVSQSHVHRQFWREILKAITQAHAEGLPMTAQVAPRPIGMVLGLSTPHAPFYGSKEMAKIAGKPLAEKVATLRDPAFRAAVLADVAANPPPASLYTPTRMFRIQGAPDYGKNPDNSVAAIAKREGRSTDEVVYDLMLEDEGRALIFIAVVNYWDHNFDAIREMQSHPAAVLGLSDGGAHVGMIADGSFPTTALTDWGRDAPGDSEQALLDSIRRQTSAPAAAVGLKDRGVIAPGMKADLNIIDLDRLGVGPLQVSPDLPAGATRILQPSRGYVATFVAGVPTYREGAATGELPGRLVRGPQPEPVAA